MSKQIVNNLTTQLNQSYSNLSNRQHQLNMAQSSLQSVSSHLSSAMTQQLSLSNAINEQTLNFNAIANLLNLYRESEGILQHPSIAISKLLSAEELAHTDVLKEAAKKNFTEGFDVGLNKINDASIEYKDPEGKTILMHAIINGFYYGVEKLLSRGANVNITDIKGANALIYSSMMPHVKWTKAIAEKIQDINYKANGFDDSAALHLLIANTNTIWFGDERLEGETNYRIQSSLKSAAFDFDRSSNTITVKQNISIGSIALGDNGTSIYSITDSATNTPVLPGTITLGATLGGYTSNQEKIKVIAKQLTDLGASINAQDGKGMMPFFIACDHRFTYLVHKLFEQYGNIMDFGLKDIHDNTYLHYASRVPSSTDILQSILTKNIGINTQNKGGGTPALQAAMRNDVETLKFLMERGADINITDIEGRHLWHYASQYGAIDSMKILKSKIPGIIDLKTANAAKSTALQVASELGQLPVVKWLVEQGADINAKTVTQGITAFFIACAKKQAAVAEYLFNQPKFNNSVIDNSGWGSLHWALEFRDQVWVDKVLKKGGIDINAQDTNGITSLSWAAAYNLNSVVTSLISKGANPKIPNKMGALAIHQAAANGAVDTLKILIKPDNINSKTSQATQFTPLYLAAQEGKLEAVKFLTEQGADLNSSSANGITPLQIAIIKGQNDAVKELLQRGADINVKTPDDSTILHYAVQFCNSETVQSIISKGVDVNAKNKGGGTPLFWAAQEGKLEAVKFLTEQGADLNSSSANGITPLQIAIIKGQNDAVKELLQRGADINVKTPDDSTILHYAVQFCNSETVQSIISKGVDVNAKNKGGGTPLFWAAQLGKEETLKLLLNHGADFNISSTEGMSPLMMALQGGHISIAKELLSKGFDLTKVTGDGNTLLHYAAQAGDAEIIKTFLESGIDVNVLNKGFGTPVLWAAMFNNLEAVKLLLTHGADINITVKSGTGYSTPTVEGAYPWHYASSMGAIDVIKFLQNSNPALINSKTKGVEGITALYFAAENGQSEAIKWLAEKNADVDAARQTDGRTPLQAAIAGNHLQATEELVKNGANINKFDNAQASPLYYSLGYAGQQVQPEMVKFLIKNGANVNQPMNDGDTPMHLTGYRANVGAMKLLISKNAKVDAQNADGKTPLHVLIEKQDLPYDQKLTSIKYLLANNASTTLKTFEQKTAIDLAKLTFPDATPWLEHPENLPPLPNMEASLVGDLSTWVMD